MHDQLICARCGGKAPQNLRKAAERRVITKAEGLLSQYGDADPVTDPLGALLRVAGRFDRLSQMLEAKVDELATIRYENMAGGEQLRAEISAYTTVLDRCRQVLVDILRLDIEERLARIEERQVEIVLAALQQGLADSSLDEAKADEVLTNVGRHLQSVA